MLLGADIEGLLDCVNAVFRHRDEIRVATRKMERLIEGAEWVGPDREKFVATWADHHRPLLYSTMHELADDAVRLRTHAERQRATSGE